MATGISAIYILDQKGKPIISRHYRDELPLQVIETFNKKLIEYLDESLLKPIFIDEDNITHLFTRYNDIIFLVVSKRQTNVTMVFSFIYKLIEVMEEYFSELDEEKIRENFVVIYELLDEMVDNGYPQTTEVKMLQEFIKTSEQSKADKKSKSKEKPQLLFGTISWRPEGIKHKENEFYLDVEEKINMIVRPNGSVLKSEILGKIRAKSLLSGMPELKLGLNDKVLLELQGKLSKGVSSVDFSDVKFHQCVRLSKFEKERIISFIPPDGEFELINYRMDHFIKPLFMVDVEIQFRGSTKLDMTVKAKSNFKSKCIATDVEFYIPVPCDAQAPEILATVGEAGYLPEKDCLLWQISEMAGRREIFLDATFSLPSIKSSDRDQFAKMPIEVIFDLESYTVSGLQVRYLKIEDQSGYEGQSWVRYVTRNGDYQIRTEFKEIV